MKKQASTPRKLTLQKIAITDLNGSRTEKMMDADGFRSTVTHVTLDITLICTLCFEPNSPLVIMFLTRLLLLFRFNDLRFNYRVARKGRFFSRPLLLNGTHQKPLSCK